MEKDNNGEITEIELEQLRALVDERKTSEKTLAGLNNKGQIVVKNRAYRRRSKTTAELEGKTRNYYTKKKTKTRRRHGKNKVVRKRK